MICVIFMLLTHGNQEICSSYQMDLPFGLHSQKHFWAFTPFYLHQVVQGTKILLQASGGPNNLLCITEIPEPVVLGTKILLQASVGPNNLL